MQAIILAGGKGTRLRPLTLHTPKPIVPIANRPFLDYQIDLLKRVGIIQVILCLSYQPRRIEEMLSDGSHHGIHVNYLMEASPLGTAGAFKNAESMIEGPSVVFNGDILTDVDLAEAMEFHTRAKAMATIILTPVEDPTTYGLVEVDPSGRVNRFLEKPGKDQISCNTINAGIYILEPEVLKYVPTGHAFSFEYELFPKLLEHRVPFFAFVSNGYWVDIGTPARYLQANLDVIAGKLLSFKPDPGNASTTFLNFAEIDELSIIGDDVTLKPGVTIRRSVIGPNCYIEENAVIEDSVVWANSRVGAGGRVVRALVGKSCHIGREARVLEGSVLGDKSVLTDFSRTLHR
ncbi:MAG: NDP-sugar synthase [Acidobacteria bacterium]|nr:NDP-sugar synthase [Acidobacteriota bacterium]